MRNPLTGPKARLFSYRAENGVFGHPTRNASDLVAPNCRFLYNNTYCFVITRDATFTKFLADKGRAVIITCLSHWKINECSVSSGQSAYCTIRSSVFPCKIGLCEFRNVREKGAKKGSLPRITICEGLVPDAESSILRFAKVDVPNDNAKRSQCGVIRRSLSHRLLKVSTGSKWTLTTTKTQSPDCMVTM